MSFTTGGTSDPGIVMGVVDRQKRSLYVMKQVEMLIGHHLEQNYCNLELLRSHVSPTSLKNFQTHYWGISR